MSVKATYSSPTDSRIIEKSLPNLRPTDTKSKVAYLGEVRSATKQLQDDINAFLTAKMEEDRGNVIASTNSTTTTKTKPPDEEEEDNYGEEKIEED